MSQEPYRVGPLAAEPLERAWGAGWLGRRVFLLTKRSHDELIYFFLFGAVIAVSVLVPVFDSFAFDACAFHRYTGLPCPGCGSTRAFVAMGHLQIGRAWAYNPSAVILYILMVSRWLLSVPAVIRPLKIRLFSSGVTIAILVIYLVLHLGHGIARLVLAAKGIIPWPPQL